MVLNVATVKISDNMVLPLRIFINRKRILENNSSKTIFEAPLLSNNSIVSLKSPNVRLYLSEYDMRNLCEEIRNDLIFIAYEVSSPEILDKIIAKLRIGNSLPYKENVVSKTEGESNKFIASHVETITRVSKFKYKLHFKKNWELDIFINDVRKLSQLRHYLIFSKYRSILPPLIVRPDRRLLLVEHSASSRKPNILIEREEDEEDPFAMQPAEEKPEIKFKYKPVLNVMSCIDIHVLQRPRRHKSKPAEGN
ncbi:hypothetical protein KAFR_0K00620 [Kazachstania africana CBS 2517]|uniref:Uncharacterized protein n=1 Tax=Kazachstania africana (strain ATCC 22294 / BCRC 22015 / CBS 2517 / CECT 1963 / NBRC 1671 / NRRL Y-8276) TaxID=1071382 RepID=H2B1B7_KAZAF|nr:hypothetical protein KAFR_0K00620 [Kazachstania africana CBS 2517]CCF60417.1 hypothetical protein KAFR_0K00620 [Kazachstania africana CBS 2517]